jgi:hypothetical protein
MIYGTVSVHYKRVKHVSMKASYWSYLLKKSLFQDLVLDESQSLEILKRMNRIVLILKVSGISAFSNFIQVLFISKWLSRET